MIKRYYYCILSGILLALAEVWLYCDYPQAVSLAKLEVKGQSSSFDQKAYLAALTQIRNNQEKAA